MPVSRGNDRHNKRLRGRGRGMPLRLRGCGGATDRRTSNNTGRTTDAKRSFVTRRRNALTSPVFFVCEGASVGPITTGRRAATFARPTCITGKGQRTVWTNRRDETGRRPQPPQERHIARWTGRRVRAFAWARRTWKAATQPSAHFSVSFSRGMS